MLPFFPSPRTDELLYSVFSRYHHASRSYSLEKTSFDLFGAKCLYSSRLFGTNLDHFSKQLHPKTLLIPKLLIKNHTVLPVYQPFTPQDRVEKAIECMTAGKAAGSPYNLLAINAFRMPALKYLQYCPVCIKEDISNYENSDDKASTYPSWYRYHQVAGVKVCRRHLVWLETSTVSLTRTHGRVHFELPDKSWGGDGVDARTHEYFEHYKYLADSVQWLFEKELEPEGLKSIADRYARLLRYHGYVTNKGCFRQKKIVKDFIDFYGESFLGKMNSGVRYNRSHSWLCDMLRPSPYRMSHPCQHFLVMRALGIQPDHFFNIENLPTKEDEAFGSPPWPCLNRASKHYGQEQIEKIEIYWTDGICKGVFNCKDCGFIYERIDPSQSGQDRLSYSRVKEFGPVWRDYIFNKVVLEKVPRRVVARELNTYHSTITRHLNSILSDGSSPQKKSKVDLSLIPLKEKEFLKILKEHPKVSRTQLFDDKRFSSITKFLYRYDKLWLMSNMPPSQKPSKVKSYKDWAKIDRHLAPRVRLACMRLIRQVDNPSKVTMAAIIRDVGHPSAIRKKLHKMPITQKILLNRIETTDQYRIRMLPVKAKQLFDENGFLTRRSLLRSMGLEMVVLADEVEAVINELLQEMP